MQKNYLVVVAGGHGTRMGGSVPKQFMDLEGKAILERTIAKFVNALPDIKVVTVLPSEYVQDWKAYCLMRCFDVPQRIVEGGITRYHSVKNALQTIPEGAAVAVHDGVRPLVSPDLIRRMFSMMGEDCRALIPVLPSVDTLRILEKDGDGNLSSAGKTCDRNEVWRVQTPQVFLSTDIKRAYEQAYELSFTDDATVVEHSGVKLSFIKGERFNIKITTPEDLEFARMIIRSNSC